MSDRIQSDRIQTTLFPLARTRRWPSVSRRMLVAAGAAVAVVLIAAGLWLMRGASGHDDVAAASADGASLTPVAALVELPPAQQHAADIHCTTLELKEIRDSRRVPGKIGYNTGRRLEVKLPVGGVLTRVFVQPGQPVKQGDQLAILTSTEVGLARSEVAAAEAEVELARQASNWAEEIASNLNGLTDVLANHPEMAEVEEQFDNRKLGDHRDRVLSAYSKMLMAEKAAASSDAVAATGGLSGLLIQERRIAREVAAAQFKSAAEQSQFEAAQQKGRARATLQQAERQLTVTRQKLQLLLGRFAEISPTQQQDAACELILRAPINGVVEERPIAEGALTAPSQILFALTNTDTLWVSAHIYDRQWSQLRPDDLGELIVDAPAVPNHTVRARVLFASVATSAESGAVPLVGEFANPDGLFRPGMFAWVTVPVSHPRRALTVPLSAVTRSDQRTFVFVEDKPGSYRPVDVDLGPTSGDVVEVRHGLEPGQRIVDRGVFVLKSELLLGETES